MIWVQVVDVFKRIVRLIIINITRIVRRIICIWLVTAGMNCVNVFIDGWTFIAEIRRQVIVFDRWQNRRRVGSQERREGKTQNGTGNDQNDSE